VYSVVFRMKMSVRITKKKVCSHLKKKYFGSLALQPLGLYVNLVSHLVVYSQPFNLVYRV
jgi:hypothetical protein